MKIFTLLLFLLLQSCAQWKPVVDPRVGQNQEEILRDILECTELTKDIKGYGMWCNPIYSGGKCKPKSEPIRQCLINRGHSVLN